MRIARPFLIALVAASAGFPLAGIAASCNDCGVITSMKYVEEKGQASGVGAVAGGVIGGVLGHQIGSGRGNTAATVVGAAGGAYAGHQIEKNQKSTTSYQVVIKMDAGNTRYFNFSNPTSYRAGDKVKIVDGKLTRQSP